jgi:hypothetical protein
MAAFARKFRSQFTGFARIGGKSMRVTKREPVPVRNQAIGTNRLDSLIGGGLPVR